MVIDSSALLAILRSEPDAPLYNAAMQSAASRHISAASYLEAAIVVDSRSDAIARSQFDQFFVKFRVSIQPVTVEQARVARQAYRDFGKGRHPAGLNFGDCFSYALAKVLDEPLLFKGGDFSQTDVEPAIER